MASPASTLPVTFDTQSPCPLCVLDTSTAPYQELYQHYHEYKHVTRDDDLYKALEAKYNHDIRDPLLKLGRQPAAIGWRVWKRHMTRHEFDPLQQMTRDAVALGGILEQLEEDGIRTTQGMDMNALKVYGTLSARRLAITKFIASQQALNGESKDGIT